MKQILCYLLLLQTLTLFFRMPTPAHSATPTGTFAFTLEGYMVQGQLTNPVIHADNSVTMMMSIDSSVQSPIGAVPIVGSGEWNGRVDGNVFSGIIENVTGNVHACVFLFCGQADYVGNGRWTGILSGVQGTGTFHGTITFTNSTFPAASLSQIPLNRPIPLSGNWTSPFQTSS